MAWSGREMRSGSHARRRVGRNTILFQVTLVLCGLLEVFDFPPILNVLDAHAAWHMCTVFHVRFWYRIREQDALTFKDDV
jgi:hypothetical protein